MVEHPLRQPGMFLRQVGGELGAVLVLALNVVAGKVHFLDLIGEHLLVEFGERDRRTSAALLRALEKVEQGYQEQSNDDPQRQIAEIVHGRPLDAGLVRETSKPADSVNR